MSKALTIELIHMKTKTNRIEQITNLNVAGLDLDDITIVKNMTKVEVLSLAVNNLTSLKELQGCYNIRELYLRKNQISNVNEVLYLQNLQKIRTMSLEDNPITRLPNYRKFVIQQLPQLERLDKDDITQNERDEAERFDSSKMQSASAQPQSNPLRRQMTIDPISDIKPRFQEKPVYEEADDNFQRQPTKNMIKASSKIERSPPQSYSNYQKRDSSPRDSPEREERQQQQFNPISRGKISPPTNDYEVIANQEEQYYRYQQQLALDEQSKMAQTPQQQQFQTRPQTGSSHKGGIHESPEARVVQPKNVRNREQVRNENILCAIIALMKELDKSGLDFVRKDCEKRLQKLE